MNQSLNPKHSKDPKNSKEPKHPKNQKLKEFLAKHKLNYAAVDVKRFIADFQEEMDKGLAGKESSLTMIPTFTSFNRPAINKPVIAIDAGGTHLRVGLISFEKATDGKDDKTEKAADSNVFNDKVTLKTQVHYLKKYPMPGTDQELSKTEFFQKIVEYLKPIINESDLIGFCFSYPMEHLPNGDGRVLALTKELNLPELKGELIGANLLKFLEKEGIEQEKHIVLLNDTVATLLAGAVQETKEYQNRLGMVEGTGFNLSYLEENKNILKLKGENFEIKKPPTDLQTERTLVGEKQVVNLEAGNFNKLEIGALEEEFFQKTKEPQGHWIEKIIAGAYLGPLALEVLKAAAKNELFNEATNDLFLQIKVAAEIDDPKAINTETMSQFLEGSLKENHFLKNDVITREEREIIKTIFETLKERAAFLLSASVAAVILKISPSRGDFDEEQEQDNNISLSYTGSVIQQMIGFKALFKKHLNRLLKENPPAPGKKFKVDFFEIEDASLVGAAVAGAGGADGDSAAKNKESN